MPVLVTMATIAYFSGRSGGTRPAFLSDTVALRDAIVNAVDEGPRRDTALALVEDLHVSITRFDDEAQSGLEHYLRESSKFDTTPSQLESGALTRLDRLRDGTLLEVVSLRGQLRDLLTEEEWNAAFTT